jgi:hypothetical protein
VITVNGVLRRITAYLKSPHPVFALRRKIQDIRNEFQTRCLMSSYNLDIMFLLVINTSDADLISCGHSMTSIGYGGYLEICSINIRESLTMGGGG